MFKYAVPKSGCWGHVIRPKDPVKAKERVNGFFEKYFEPLVPEWDVTRQITVMVNWKGSVLPNVEWPEEFSDAENQGTLFMLTGDRVMFMGGIYFPISTTEGGSYQFLERFVADAPFRMDMRNFRVRVVGPSGRCRWEKPDGEIAVRLRGVFD